MRALGKTLVLSISLLAIAILAKPQKKEMTDANYAAEALSAAPKAIGEGAAVVRVGNDGTMRTIREGRNGFTCLAVDTDEMCNDANSMEFIHALMRKEPPPDKVGISSAGSRR
jgi:hypothetical protein